MGLLLLLPREIKPPRDSDVWRYVEEYMRPGLPTMRRGDASSRAAFAATYQPDYVPPWWYTDRRAPPGMMLSVYVVQLFAWAGIPGAHATPDTVRVPGDYDTLIRRFEEIRRGHCFGWSARRTEDPRPRICPGCRALDGEHTFGPGCTLTEDT